MKPNAVFYFLQTFVCLFPLNAKSVFFNESGLSFLQKFGRLYSLIDSFFFDSQKYLLRYPELSLNITVEASYETRKQKQHSFYGTGEIDDFQSKSDKFPNQKEQYYSRFRLGENPEDRFYSIFLHGDPWEKSSLVSDISVNFVGASGGFESTMSFENFSCRFTAPIPYEYLVPLDVLKKDSDKVLRRQMKEKNHILRCPLPVALKDQLQKMSLPHSMSEGDQYIRLDLYRGETPVLANITVRRLHEMDRRSFKLTVSTMTNRVNDPLLIEWLVFYLLAGVEHFYLFDNSHSYSYSHSRAKARSSTTNNQDPLRLLRPFLDAELVTLISLPYTAEKHWDAIQSASAQISLQQFGPYSEWMGIFDQDEFLLPMSSLKKRDGHFKDPTFLSELLEPFKSIRKYGMPVDTILFESLEMSCGRRRDPRKPLYLLDRVSQQVAMQLLPAVTTHCTEKGWLFSGQHAKLFVRPAQLLYLSSCHSSGGVHVNGDPAKDGVFLHFNNHWYGYSRATTLHLPGKPEPGYMIMRDFVLASLKSIGFLIRGVNTTR